MGNIVVKLWEFTDDDIALYRKWIVESNPESTTCRPAGDTDLEEMKRRFRERLDGETAGHFAVRRIVDEVLVGREANFDLNSRNRSAEIGYLVGTEFRGRGYAHQAVWLLLRRLFENLNLNKAMAQTGEFNTESIAVLQKPGFNQDGRLRQHHPVDGKIYDDLFYSKLRDEFNPGDFG